MGAVTLSFRHLVIPVLAATVACGGGSPSAGVVPAPADPETSVSQFLTAASAGDLEAMARLWGDERGPSSSTNVIPREERTRRLTIMQRLLRSDSFQITGTNALDPAKPVVTAAISQGTRRYSVPFTVVRWQTHGWLVKEIDLTPAMPAAGPRTPSN